MVEVINKMTQFFPGLAVIANIIFIVFLVLQIADDYDKIMAFLKKVFDFRRHLDTLFWANKRKRYNKVLYSKDYLKWQNEIMKKIYGPLIERVKTEKKLDINFTSIKLEDLKEEYEAVTLRLLKPIDFPFEGVCDKQKLERKGNISEEKYANSQKKYKREVKQYYRLIRSTIRYPKRMGYMLDDNILDSNGNLEIKAYCGNYENNLKTSHILEYELYLKYCKYGWKFKQNDREEILKKLPIRNEIHQYFKEAGNESNVLLSGKGRASLLGVQVFVLIKNYTGKYDVLRIRRSENVAAKPGFLQFIPSGGFEAMNDCVDYDSQWDNYSLSKIIFRELLEECFGQDEDDNKINGNNISPDKIYGNTYVKEIINKLRNQNDGSKIQLLGSAMSLVGLRHELSFILKIDDPEFSTAFIGNYETKTAIHLVDIELLERKEFWMEDDIKKLNCTSAALFELARQSDIYKSCLNGVQ